MFNRSSSSPVLSDFVNYLSAMASKGEERVPALSVLSREMGISIAALREQLEVARAMGFVEVRPRTGIRRLSYSFTPAVKQSLAYANCLNPNSFEAFSDLRNHIEAAYFRQAVCLLTETDLDILQNIVRSAQAKLHQNPVQIPHEEHRELHLSIYRRLNNPFVLGILEAYWELYELTGKNVYTDYAYLERVWLYHQEMVEAIVKGDIVGGYETLVEHMGLIHHRNTSMLPQQFE